MSLLLRRRYAKKKAENKALDNKTVAELKETAKEKEVKDYQSMKKSELIRVLGGD